MLRTQDRPVPLSVDALRKVIKAALDNQGKARFRYGVNLFEKLQGHGVSIQDLLYVCHQWQILRSMRWQKGAWRYRIEGDNCNGQWMAAVVAIWRDDVIAITGFGFTKGRNKKP